MKKIIIFLAVALSTLSIFAEKVGDISKVGNNAYMLVCELNTAEQNVKFQHNLTVMQRSARVIDSIKAQIKTESDATKKAKLETALKEIERDFATNDAAMQKAYMFSSHRKYKMLFLETNICVPLKETELSSLKDEDGNTLDPMKIFQRENSSFYIKSKVSGIKENQELQRMIAYVVNRRSEMEKLRKELLSTTDAVAQMDITKRLGAGENALMEAEENLRKEYGIKPKSNYLIETSKLKLYLILTPEELAKIEAQKS